ncbi:DNA glycosylase AlkZ-like family protein [Corynebacterium tapiri]|uniref:Winged helix DNA-binding domain-containing protein n=1 Tax=Corynebacterium tapiri TaxID=1448266 RepID=A0A5C4U2M1_9CORY|nr:crosslink repair DNA glycosylase YcaQ family protein [Corynebacterium tapiri]TNL95353.1 winged helix DNA-binding domain-containing protein [Corynebacterium tapiri]
MDLAELRARRLIAQRLSPSAAAPDLQVDAVHWMLCTQGQNAAAGQRALKLRGQEDFSAVVRCWPQRGTLHLVAADDARWLMRLGHPRVERAAALRRTRMGIDPAHVDTARAALHAALYDQPLERKKIYALWEDAGIDTAQGRGPHLVRALGGAGDIVQVEPEIFAHLDTLGVSHREPEQPLVEMARRFAHSHGPVSVKDLAWWSGQTQRDCRQALDQAGLERDDDWYVPAWQKDITAGELKEALEQEYHLPAFDEYLLGYADKSFALPDELRPRVLTKNGISWDFVVRDGVVCGREGDV